MVRAHAKNVFDYVMSVMWRAKWVDVVCLGVEGSIRQLNSLPTHLTTKRVQPLYGACQPSIADDAKCCAFLPFRFGLPLLGRLGLREMCCNQRFNCFVVVQIAFKRALRDVSYCVTKFLISDRIGEEIKIPIHADAVFVRFVTAIVPRVCVCDSIPGPARTLGVLGSLRIKCIDAIGSLC